MDRQLKDIKFERMTIQPPFGPKSKKYSDTDVTVIVAKERRKSTDRPIINWKLVTNLPIENLDQAIEKLNWYALRWRIETYFKVLKSGCKIVESKLRTAEGLVKFIAVSCIIAWRIYKQHVHRGWRSN